MSTEQENYKRLEELSGSDFEIADHQPDITGWEIFDSAGDYIGDVDDLIFDKESLKIRYIITSLEGYELDQEKQVLIPIGIVTLKEDEDEILLTEAISAKLPLLPSYDNQRITPEDELQIRNVLTGTAENVVSAMISSHHKDEFYDHSHFIDKGYTRNPAGKDGHDKGEIM